MAKNKIHTYEQLYAKMMDVNRVGLTMLSEKVFKMWLDDLQEKWYDKYDPVVYNRTEAILKALVKTDVEQKGNNLIVKVYIDEGIMNIYHPNSQGYLDGLEVIKLVEQEGMTLTNGVIRNPANAYEDTLEWVRSNYESYLAQVMKMETKLNIKIR